MFEVIESEDVQLQNKKFIIADKLLKNVQEKCKIFKINILKKIKGNDLKNIICIHPFSGKGYEFDVPLISGSFVEDNEGTGIVHIAPSYGEDDYNLALENNIAISDIVKDDGCYKDDTPIFAGVHVFKAHTSVIEKLKEVNSLIGVRDYIHSYPHS